METLAEEWMRSFMIPSIHAVLLSSIEVFVAASAVCVAFVFVPVF